MLNKRVTIAFVLLPFFILAFPGIGLAGKGNLTILHTNDIHSHLGEFSRLATKIREIKEMKTKNNEPVLLVDSGDFTVGTLYHTLATTLSLELTLMNTLGYDATTLGNHEFEWGPGALAKLIDIAKRNGDGSTVPIIASNIIFNFFDSRDNDLKILYDTGAIQPYLIKDLSNGLKVGIIGLLGKRAEGEMLQAAPVRFNHNTEFIQHRVDMLRSKGVDLIVCLSHSGLEEDRKLAESIKGIDIIIAGHCHTALTQPLRVGSTLIVEAGSYVKYLGKLEVLIDEEKIYLSSYKLIPMDDTITRDETVEEVINGYKSVVDRQILNPLGLAFDRVLIKTSFDLMGKTKSVGETNLGDLVTDGIRFAIDACEPEDSVDFALQPTGFIRGDINKGIVKTSDAFRLLSLGIGPDMKPGYPLVSFYLNAQEIKRTLEVSTYLSLSRNSDYFLQVSGLRFWYNPLRPKFRKITKIEIWDPALGQYITFDTSESKTLYKVGTNLLLLDALALARRYLPWPIVPKDKEENPISIVDSVGREKTLVDGDPESSGIQEIKEWQAFTRYLLHFPDVDGDSIPDVPLKYIKPQRRINRPPEELLNYQTQRKNPWIGMGAALAFPSLGHAYAKNWYPSGLKFLLLELGALILASQESTRDAGLLTLISLKIWEFGDVYQAVTEYNRELAKKYNLELSLGNGRLRLGMSYKF